MSEYVVPVEINKILLRSLVWDNSNTRENINLAWKWIEDHTAPYEEMGQ